MKPSSPEKITTRYAIRVLWDRRTLEAVRYFVAKCTAQECQWFHFIDKDVNEATKVITYFISGMIIPEQVVSGATVETDGKGLLNAYNELKEAHGLMVRNPEGKLVRPTDTEGNPIFPSDEDADAFRTDCARMGVWCHSHVKMKTDPSSTDNTQWDEWIQAKATGPDAEPVMMVIFNQQDEYYCRLYDPEERAQFNCPPFLPFDGFDFSDIDAALKDKIKNKVWSTNNYTTGRTNTSPVGYTSNSPKSEGTTTVVRSSPTNPQKDTSGGTTSQTTTTKNLPNESVRSKGDPFLITYVGGHSAEFLALGKALNSKTGDSKSVKEYCDLLNDYFDSDNVAFYIVDQIIFGKNPNILELYAIDRDDKEVQQYHRNARADLERHLLNEDTESEFIFIIAAEIAFMYTFQQGLHDVALTLQTDLHRYIGTKMEIAEA